MILFLSLNWLLATVLTIDSNTGGKLLAFLGHTDMQRIQVIHLLLSVQDGLSNGIALTGQTFAHFL